MAGARVSTAAERRAWLVTEAGRLKERLDRLNLQLQGDPDAWLEIVQRMPPDVAEVTVDKPLAEARQTALALATVVKTLDGTATGEEAPGKSEDPADEIQRKREEKRKEAARGLAQAH
jgi:hypothetical protein